MAKAPRVLVLHGPNLNLLGTRQPELYGTRTLEQVDTDLGRLGAELGASLDCRQSNHEGALVDWIQEMTGTFDGAVLNLGGYSHTSVALRDAVAAVALPCVCVHITQVESREPFRGASMIGPVCVGSISGFGTESYGLGLRALIGYLRDLGAR